jgi:hypothetical protein
MPAGSPSSAAQASLSGKFVAQVSEPKQFEQILVVLPARHVQHRQGFVGVIRCDAVGELVEDPVFAVENDVGAIERVWFVLSQPRQLARLRTGVDSGAAACESFLCGAVAVPALNLFGGASVAPENALAHGVALGIDHPCAVAVAGDADACPLLRCNLRSNSADACADVLPNLNRILFGRVR